MLVLQLRLLLQLTWVHLLSRWQNGSHSFFISHHPGHRKITVASHHPSQCKITVAVVGGGRLSLQCCGSVANSAGTSSRVIQMVKSLLSVPIGYFNSCIMAILLGWLPV